MRLRLIAILLSCTLGTVMSWVCLPDDLGFEGHHLVEPDCDEMEHWFSCRNIDTAPPDVYLGYLYMHHTSETLGPNGSVRYADTGEPYVHSVMACSSCHFTGGHVPFGATYFQTPSKYKPDPETGLGPYFRPLGHHRDVADAIIDCMRNCINASRSPAHDDPVVLSLVRYIEWVSEGIIDPAMQEDWTLLPPEAGTRLPSIDNVLSMRADPEHGASLYFNQCADCHDEDGPGAGEYRDDEERPRVPALWGTQNGYSRGAAFYRVPVLAGFLQRHMPYGDPQTLSDQEALDIAAYINAPDKPRPPGQGDELFCHDDPDGIPSALRKPADWLVGCEYPGERQFFEDQNIDYDDMVLNGPWVALADWRAQEIERLLGSQETLVVPESFSVFRGFLVDGNLASITESDDMRASINSGFVLNPSEAPVWLIFEASVPGAIDFQLESQASSTGLTYTVEAFNWISAEYETIGMQQELFNSDHTQNYVLDSVNHVDNAGSVRTRVGWRQTGITISLPWTVRVDQVGWNQ